MNKVSVVGTVGIPASYGGFESLVENLTLNSSKDIEYTVYCSSKAYDDEIRSHNRAKLVYLPLKANGASSILYDIVSLIHTIKDKPDTVLILGVSGCLFLPVYRLLSKTKIITNIDGLEWKREKWGKFTRRFLKFSEKIAVKFSDVVVTDNQVITNYVKSEYGINSVTIAYGGDHAIRKLDVIDPESDFALALCRIEPENNVEMILRAFSKTNHNLKFIGNWQNSLYGRNLFSQFSQFENIELISPIYDLDHLYILRRQCSWYIHGHSAGGTNPSLVEMMHFGCPIFAFDCNFNRYSTNNEAGYFKDEIELIKLVGSSLSSTNDKNGSSMLSFATKNYTWQVIKDRYESIY